MRQNATDLAGIRCLSGLTCQRYFTFRFDRSNRGNMVYLNRILSSRKCTQPTMAERINGLLNVTTSISTSFLVKE